MNRLERISTVRTRYWCCFFVCDTCNIINYLRKYYIRHNLTFFYLIIKLLPRSQLFLVKSELLVDKGSYFFRGRTCSQWGYLQKSYFSKQVLLQSIKNFTVVTFSEKDIFEKSNIQLFGAFLLRIFLYLDLIRRDYPYLSVFIPNAGKYRSE